MQQITKLDLGTEDCSKIRMTSNHILIKKANKNWYAISLNKSKLATCQNGIPLPILN
jgi:hypothetical protein